MQRGCSEHLVTAVGGRTHRQRLVDAEADLALDPDQMKTARRQPRRAGMHPRSIDRRAEDPAFGREPYFVSADIFAEPARDRVLDRVGIRRRLWPPRFGQSGDWLTLPRPDECCRRRFDLFRAHRNTPAFADYAASTAPRYSSAAETPPPRCGMPARCSPISTPHNVPHSIKSLKCPRWPMRKILPFILPSPVPSDMSKPSRIMSRTRSASCPSGTSTAVSEFEYSRGSAHKTSRPQPLTARRVASPCRAWRANTASSPSSSSSILSASRSP